MLRLQDNPHVSGILQAPLCLLMVGLALYLFRGIYGEAITSYPMNGGSYNLLINTTSKSVAALGACLSIIAYIATGVVRPLLYTHKAPS